MRSPQNKGRTKYNQYTNDNIENSGNRFVSFSLQLQKECQGTQNRTQAQMSCKAVRVFSLVQYKKDVTAVGRDTPLRKILR